MIEFRSVQPLWEIHLPQSHNFLIWITLPGITIKLTFPTISPQKIHGYILKQVWKSRFSFENQRLLLYTDVLIFQLVSSSRHILLPFMFHMDTRAFVLNHRSDAPVLMLRHLPSSFPSWPRSGLTYQWCLIMPSLNSSLLPHLSVPWYSAYCHESTFYLPLPRSNFSCGLG